MASRTVAAKRKRSSSSGTKKSSMKRRQPANNSSTGEQSPFIDLTEEVEVVDLTTVNDSPVMFSSSSLLSCRESGSQTTSEQQLDRSTSPDLPVIDFGYCPNTNSTSLLPDKSAEKVKVGCPVCLDDRQEILKNKKFLMSTVCGHVFCNECIKHAIQMSRHCPSCRKKLTQRQIHPIFL